VSRRTVFREKISCIERRAYESASEPMVASVTAVEPRARL
jgi:hypothetical protein